MSVKFKKGQILTVLPTHEYFYQMGGKWRYDGHHYGGFHKVTNLKSGITYNGLLELTLERYFKPSTLSMVNK